MSDVNKALRDLAFGGEGWRNVATRRLLHDLTLEERGERAAALMEVEDHIFQLEAQVNAARQLLVRLGASRNLSKDQRRDIARFLEDSL